MEKFEYIVTIEAPSAEHAAIVMGERLGYDETYEDENGNEFNYTISSYDRVIDQK